MAANDGTLVLVHGAWADGSSWAKVIASLAASGVKAVAVPLPLTSFQDNRAALDRTPERVEAPVILAGHAYAAAVIGATRNDKVKALVYVAAPAPDEGETVADVFTRGAPRSAGGQARAGRARVDVPARSRVRRRLRAKRLQGRLAVLAAVHRPISPACITVKMERPLWKDRPSWFLVAEQDRMIVEDNHRFMAERMKARVRPILSTTRLS